MSSLGTLALVDGTGAASNYSLNSAVINITKRVLSLIRIENYMMQHECVSGRFNTNVTWSLVKRLNHSGHSHISSANAGSYKYSNLSEH